MDLGKVARRYLIPPIVISVYLFVRRKCQVSFRSEIELTKNLVIGEHVEISSYCRLKSNDGPLEIGARTAISPFSCLASGSSGLYIGEDCMIGPAATIVASNHVYTNIEKTMRSQGFKSTGIRIGNNVHITSGVVILDGAEIGDGSIITPNSVVSSKLPANVIASGNPAKVIFTRR